MLLKVALGIGAGAIVGGLLGMTRSCETGACPLTASPWRGAMFGGFMGALIVIGSLGTASPPESDAALEADGQSAPITGPDAVTGEEAVAIRSVSEKDFGKAVGQGIVLVDFWAPWCGPCRQQMPILESVAKQLGPYASIVKVNVDDNQALAQRLKVEGIPTMILFVNGRQVDRFVGVQSEKTLLAAIRTEVRKQDTTIASAEDQSPPKL